MRRDVEVDLTFLPTEHGGRRGPARSGYRAQVYCAGHDWDAQQEFPDVSQVQPGETVCAYLTFLAPDQHVGRLRPGLPFLLREGQRVVGYGCVRRLLDLQHSAAGGPSESGGGETGEPAAGSASPVVIREGGDSLELVGTDRVPAHLPGAGDTRLAIRVQSRGFVGQGSAWVEAPVLRAFVGQLRQLDARRQGRAELVSMSPGEFGLRVYATDRAGHLAVAGRLTGAGQALEFEFS